jgi:asparagine synthase (glutamine-hydrolysing)
MSGLCGWYSCGGALPPAPEVITDMAVPITRYSCGTLRTGGANFGAVAAACVGSGVDIYQDAGHLVAVWGHIRFSDAGLGALAHQEGIAYAISQGYTRNGTQLFSTLVGSFVLAILDGKNEKAVLAVDRMATRPLCFHTIGNQLIFGTTLDAINAFPVVRQGVNLQAIYDYVYFHMVPAPGTIHPGTGRLLPGEYISFANGTATTARYWNMQFVENEAQPLPALKKQFLATLRESVRDAAAQGSVGAFLSGGTDSSTLAGMLGEVSGRPARTYSIGFEAKGYDEMEYARIAARHFGTHHHEYYVTPDDVVAAIPQIALVHDQPFGNASAVPTFYCARLARNDGIDTLLGGDGGDELFGGNERYAMQYLYSLYSDSPAFLRKGLIEPVASLLPAMGIAGKLRRYIKHASIPMPARYDHYNLIERLGASSIFSPEFLASIDRKQPSMQMAQVYHAAEAQSLVNRMLALDLKYTLADNDLPKVTRSCELAGVDVRFPLLDDSVVAFSARLPPNLKLRGTRLRYFFKEALRGFLPDEIITKTKHGFGLPVGMWLQSHQPLKQLALDSLSDLKRRQIIRPSFIDELTSTYVNQHASYYGTMVWVLMMLEQWFRQHRTSP